MAGLVDIQIIRRTEALDTNIIVQLVAATIPKQQDKVMQLLLQPKTRFMVPDAAIIEAVHVLETKLLWTRPMVGKAIEQIMALDNIECNREILSDLLPEYHQHPKLSFVDCYLAAHAAAEGYEPLWTFDRAFAEQSGTAKEL